MSKAKRTPMDQEAASRIARTTALKHGGMIPAGDFAGRADATVKRRIAVSTSAPKPATKERAMTRQDVSRITRDASLRNDGATPAKRSGNSSVAAAQLNIVVSTPAPSPAPKERQMTRQDVSRIARDAALQNDGVIPERSFTSRSDAAVQRRIAMEKPAPKAAPKKRRK